jgi:hypothetical protein
MVSTILWRFSNSNTDPSVIEPQELVLSMKLIITPSETLKNLLIVPRSSTARAVPRPNPFPEKKLSRKRSATPIPAPSIPGEFTNVTSIDPQDFARFQRFEEFMRVVCPSLGPPKAFQLMMNP